MCMFVHTENFSVDSYIYVSLLLLIWTLRILFWCLPPVNHFQIREAKIITLAKCYILARFSFAESIFFFFYHHSKISVTTKSSLFPVPFQHKTKNILKTFFKKLNVFLIWKAEYLFVSNMFMEITINVYFKGKF